MMILKEGSENRRKDKMRERNFYKIDEILLFVGWSLVVLLTPIGLVLFFDLTGADSISKFISRLFLFLFVSLPPFVIIGIGRHFRKKDKKLNQFANLLETAPEIDVYDILKTTGMGIPEIQSGIKRIEELGVGFYELDLEQNKVYDKRLKSQYILVEQCPNCGATLGKKFLLILDTVPTCEYCKVPFQMDYWNQLKQESIESIAKNNLEKYRIEMSDNGQINLQVFFLLLFTFWPLAIFYLIYRDNPMFKSLNKLK